MKTKLYDIPIDSGLTEEKRLAIGQFIALNSVHSKTPVRHKWDETDGSLLSIQAPPVLLEVFFRPERVEVFGVAPAWVRLLFTRKRQEEIYGRLREILKATGFIASKA